MGSTQKGKVPDVYGHTPAPNNYNPDALFTKNKAASWGMGSGNRPALSQPPSTPGPGAYTPKRAKPKAYFMAGKEKMYVKESPGPGAYTPNSNSVK
jgi:hypothetical protein